MNLFLVKLKSCSPQFTLIAVRFYFIALDKKQLLRVFFQNDLIEKFILILFANIDFFVLVKEALFMKFIIKNLSCQ